MPLVKEEYIPTIDAILRVSDLQKITVKKIRFALESLFTTQFSNNEESKKEINNIILERFYKLQDEEPNLNADLSLPDQIKKLTEQNRLLTTQLNLSIKKSDLLKSKTKHKKTTKAPHQSALTTMKWRISKELGDVLGDHADIPRPQIMKSLWVYIKSHDLQSKDDRRVIMCDDKLKAIFDNVESINQFSMTTKLNNHIFRIPPEEQEPKAEETNDDDNETH